MIRSEFYFCAEDPIPLVKEYNTVIESRDPEPRSAEYMTVFIYHGCSGLSWYVAVIPQAAWISLTHATRSTGELENWSRRTWASDAMAAIGVAGLPSRCR